MRHKVARLVTVVGSLVLASGALVAQDTGTNGGRPVKIGGALGASIPLGDFGDGADLGFHIGGLVETMRPIGPFTLRGEITYNRFGLSEDFFDDVPFDVDGDASILNFLANIIYPFGAPESTARPYFIGGLGVYRLSVSADAGGFDVSDSETKFGFNVGGGFSFNLSGFDTFIEARFHSVLTEDSSTNFIPISFGFRF